MARAEIWWFRAGLLLNSLTEFDDADAAPTFAVGVLIALVHLYYIGYFLFHLLPELFATVRTMYHLPRSFLSVGRLGLSICGTLLSRCHPSSVLRCVPQAWT